MSGRLTSESFWPLPPSTVTKPIDGGSSSPVVDSDYCDSPIQPPSTVKKRPASSLSTIMKRPSASAACENQYTKMRYKTGAIGIRVRGGNQVMQVHIPGADDEAVEKFADQCIDALQAGQSVDIVKHWLRGEKAKLFS